MRLLLDEHFSPSLAEQLRERKVDAIPVAETAEVSRAELRGRPDEELLRWAQHENRVLVTENVRDFMPLHRSMLERGELHSGIVFTSHRRFPRHSGALGLLVTALTELAHSRDAADLSGDIVWL